MFESFFPKPKLFFSSAAVWSLAAVLIWYGFAESLGAKLGFGATPEGQEPIIGLGHFVTPEALWFYVYYAICTFIFGGFWWVYSRNHRWQLWSIWGTSLLVFITYYGVQVSVAINNWFRPFFDAIQRALNNDPSVTALDLYKLLFIYAQIAVVAIIVFALTRYFTSHYIFRWRTAMNDYYVKKWAHVRHIEGASQRIQEDAMRFAQIMEDLGISMIDAVMTLIAFLPILLELSKHVKELPIVGEIPAPLVSAAIFWSIFGTVLMAIAGIKLPGLQFHNQRVEAAYRKELVYGEDHEDRAQPLTLSELFINVRRNYFRIYFHYVYFNMVRSLYINANNVFGYFILIPTITAAVAQRISLGVMQQILTAFSQVASSFQILVNSWPTIVELMSIYKRLRAFELSALERAANPPSDGESQAPEPEKAL